MAIFMAKVPEIPGKPMYVCVAARTERSSYWIIRRTFNDERFGTKDHENPPIKIQRPEEVSFIEARDKRTVPLGYEVIYSDALKKRFREDAKERVQLTLQSLRIG